MERLNISTATRRSVSTMRIPAGQRIIEFNHKEGNLFLEVDKEDYPSLVNMLASQLSWQEKRELAEELEEEAMEEECDEQN
ncbi:MAG: hypothetical protein ACRBF0_19930 [Calditrichia bacterium]